MAVFLRGSELSFIQVETVSGSEFDLILTGNYNYMNTYEIENIINGNYIYFKEN